MAQDGILHIDGFNWSTLLASEIELRRLSADASRIRREKEDNTFRKYRDNLTKWIENHGGSIWNTIGDCTIADGFRSIDEAVGAAMSVQRGLTEFDINDNELEDPLFVRIGVTRGFLPDVPQDKRGEHLTPALNVAGHLQTNCPPGRIRISREAFDALRFGKQNFRPGLTVDQKSLSAGSFVWLDRMLTKQELRSLDSLPPRQQRSYPPIVVSESYLVREPYTGDFSDIPKILHNALVIIGEARPENQTQGPVSHPASTSDAVGVLEVLAALQASPGVSAGVDEWIDSVDLASQTNIVVIGSPAVNLFAYAFNLVLPAGFIREYSSPLRIRVRDQDQERFFPSDIDHSGFDRHLGLVLLARNPMNPKHALLWIAGVSGMATQAASRLVRELIINSTETLNKMGVERPNVAVVAPKWESGYGPEQYRGVWRVNNYAVLWAGRQ